MELQLYLRYRNVIVHPSATVAGSRCTAWVVRRSSLRRCMARLSLQKMCTHLSVIYLMTGVEYIECQLSTRSLCNDCHFCPKKSLWFILLFFRTALYNNKIAENRVKITTFWLSNIRTCRQPTVFLMYVVRANNWYEFFYSLFEEKLGIVLLSGSEVGLESELSRRFEAPWIRKPHVPSFIYMCVQILWLD